MNNNSEENNEALSEQELAKAEELQAEIRRKISILLADSLTPTAFKEAFAEEKGVG